MDWLVGVHATEHRGVDRGLSLRQDDAVASLGLRRVFRVHARQVHASELAHACRCRCSLAVLAARPAKTRPPGCWLRALWVLATALGHSPCQLHNELSQLPCRWLPQLCRIVEDSGLERVGHGLARIPVAREMAAQVLVVVALAGGTKRPAAGLELRGLLRSHWAVKRILLLLHCLPRRSRRRKILITMGLARLQETRGSSAVVEVLCVSALLRLIRLSCTERQLAAPEGRLSARQRR